MPNDAKLGLLAGVAGVVATAVVFFQNPNPPAAPAGPPVAAALAATPVPVARVPADPPRPAAEPPAAVVVAGTRKEVEARPTSRPATPDEDE